MKVTLTEQEIIEAVKEWCGRRFQLGENVSVGWRTHPVDPRAGTYRLEFTLDGVEIPPKEGPYR